MSHSTPPEENNPLYDWSAALKQMKEGGVNALFPHGPSEPNLSEEDEYGPFLTRIVVMSPELQAFADKHMVDSVSLPTPISTTHKGLMKFFEGGISEKDIAKFSKLRLVEGSYQAHFLTEKTKLSIPPDCNVMAIWQFGQGAKVNSTNITYPVANFTIEDLMPSRCYARRVAIIAYDEESAYVTLVHLLTGLVSTSDPIHEILKNER